MKTQGVCDGLPAGADHCTRYGEKMCGREAIPVWASRIDPDRGADLTLLLGAVGAVHRDVPVIMVIRSGEAKYPWEQPQSLRHENGKFGKVEPQRLQSPPTGLAVA